MVLQDIIRKKKLSRVGEVLDTDIMRIVRIRKTQILRLCIFCAADMRLGEVKNFAQEGQGDHGNFPCKRRFAKSLWFKSPPFSARLKMPQENKRLRVARGILMLGTLH